MKFFLVTEEYDSLAGHMQSPIEDQSVPLTSTDFFEAANEATNIFNSRKKYYGGTEPIKFPRNPRLVGKLED